MLRTESLHAGWTDARDESTAVAELYDQIGKPGNDPGFFFCSSEFDPDRLAKAMNEAFGSRLVGCMTAGELTPAGYRQGTLTGFTMSSSIAAVESHLMTGIKNPDSLEIASIGRSVRSAKKDPGFPGRNGNGFGMLLIDGQAMSEELVLGLLKPAIGDLPLVGGSSGGNSGRHSGRYSERYSERYSSQVYFNGRFHAESAVFCHVQTTRPIHLFHTHHFEPTDQQMIITRVDAAKRVVLEFNGCPATREYARLTGHLPTCLDGSVFANHPLMVKVGREHFVRSIRQATGAGGLQFFCPVEEGMVFKGTRGMGIIHQTQGALAGIHEVLDPEFIIGFDSISRRRELENRGLVDWMSEIMVDNRVVGFNTWGEQFGGIHFNQSLAGVAIGY